MGVNNTPMSERVHIGFFGRRNAGKSSVMNAVTGQDLAVVSDVKGTRRIRYISQWSCFRRSGCDDRYTGNRR